LQVNKKTKIMNKLKIVFVDDDRLVLQSLQRVARSRKLNVELVQATSASQAESIIAVNHCDVVVTDIRLPDMGGTDFLARVQQRWPRILRILLTNDAEGSAITGRLLASHQTLAKPATPEFLLEAIQSASRLRFLLMNERLREVAHRMEYFPVVPRVYMELNKELRKENYSIQSLSRIISQDMGLTTAILKVVNTPYFGLSRHVDDPQQAVTILGGSIIRGLVLSEGVFKPQDQDMYPGFDTERLWSHCLETARCCRAVIRSEGMTGRMVEDAFLSGLLHDVGKIVLAEGCPEEYVGVIMQSQTRNVPLVDIETSILGVTHAQVGAYLLGLWGFSEPALVAIAQHHGLLRDCQPTLLSAVIHVVDVALHNRYIVSSGYAQHALDAELLAVGGGQDAFERWVALVDAEIDANC
jgi:HD-like signal output (HDOD) protein